MEKIKQVIKRHLKYRSVCHGYSHAEHVEKVALKIATKYPNTNKHVISAIALLHDVWDHKFVDDSNRMKERYKTILLENGYNETQIQSIYESIDDLSWSKEKIPKSLEGKIVQDADRVSGLGAIGILRACTYGAIDGGEFDVTIQHLIDKCLLLRDRLNLPESKEMAEERHNFLLQFIEQYSKETRDF